MISEQATDVSSMALEVATESELADWLAKHGSTVVYRHGRYWMSSHGGFYQPVHWMARLQPDEIQKPTLWCWGYRAVLDDSAEALANATLPVHYFDRVAGFDADCLSKNKRYTLRICQSNVKIRPVDELELLVEQGYPLYLSSVDRTGYGHRKSRSAYRRAMARFFDAGFVSVLGGFVGGRLGGYLISLCVAKTAYLDTLVVGTAERSYQIGTGLKYAFIKYLSERGGPVTEVIDGLHARENQGLCRYKEQMGFKIVRVPSMVWFMPGAEKSLKMRWPHKYYRITGCE
jgi:hypothetical protein